MKSTLITVDEADARLAGFQDVFPPEDVPLAQAGGRVLRTAIRADREYPALDRSRMDGIAIAFAAWEMGVRDFPVGEWRAPAIRRVDWMTPRGVSRL